MALLEGPGESGWKEWSTRGKNAENKFSNFAKDQLFEQSLELRALSPKLCIRVSAGETWNQMEWNPLGSAALCDPVNWIAPKWRGYTAAGLSLELYDHFSWILCYGSSLRWHQGENSLPLNHVTEHRKEFTWLQAQHWNGASFPFLSLFLGPIHLGP